MRKRILTTILAGIMVVSMTACGNKTTEAPETTILETVVETAEITEESSFEEIKEYKLDNTAEAVDSMQPTTAVTTTETPKTSKSPKETSAPITTANPTVTPKTTTASNSTGKTGSTTTVSSTKIEATATPKPGATTKPTATATATPKPTTKPTATPATTPQPTATPKPACTHTSCRSVTVVEANCQHDGYGELYCNLCGEYLGKDYYPQSGHGSTSRHTTSEPTCTSGGWWEETCDLCGAVINSGSIDSLGCVDNGDGWCSRCGAELRDHSQPDVPSVDDVLKDFYGDTTPASGSDNNNSDTTTTSIENNSVTE